MSSATGHDWNQTDSVVGARANPSYQGCGSALYERLYEHTSIPMISQGGVIEKEHAQYLRQGRYTPQNILT